MNFGDCITGCGKGLESFMFGSGLPHTNPTREQGECLRTLAGTRPRRSTLRVELCAYHSWSALTTDCTDHTDRKSNRMLFPSARSVQSVVQFPPSRFSSYSLAGASGSSKHASCRSVSEPLVKRSNHGLHGSNGSKVKSGVIPIRDPCNPWSHSDRQGSQSIHSLALRARWCNSVVRAIDPARSSELPSR